MLNPYKKSTKRPSNSLTYNLSLLISIFFKIAINIKDVNLCFSFKLYAIAFLYYNSKVKL
jgi:hypothetical protein